MKQAALRQRIHPENRLGLIPRLEPVDRRQQKLVGTGSEPLQRGQRVGTSPEAVVVEHLARPRRHLQDAVALRPGGAAPFPPADHRSAQRRVEPQQIVRAPLHRRDVVRIEQRLEHRQVVLQIVDRAGRILRCRPRQARPALRGGIRRQQPMVRHAAGDRSHHVERIERRDPRAGFADVEPRVRQVESLAGGADRDLEQQALGGALRSSWPASSGSMARRRSSSRSGSSRGRWGTTRSARPGTKTMRTLAAAGLMRRADKEPAVAPGGRLPIECHQPIVKHVARFFERHRSDTLHRTEIGQRLQDARRFVERRGLPAPRTARAIRPRWSRRASQAAWR